MHAPGRDDWRWKNDGVVGYDGGYVGVGCVWWDMAQKDSVQKELQMQRARGEEYEHKPRLSGKVNVSADAQHVSPFAEQWRSGI